MSPRRTAIVVPAVLAVVLGLILTGLGPASAGVPPPERDRPVLVSPSEKPAGTSWAVWEARYLKWWLEFPTPVNPALHPENERNCEPRHGIVFVMAWGTKAGCEVPAQRLVLFSPLGWSCSTAEGNGHAWKTLRRCARTNFRKELTDIKLQVFLDGQAVANPWRWTFDGSRGVVTYPKKAVWGVPPGKSRVVGKGLYYMLQPMEPGKHVIRVRMLEDGKVTRIKFGLTVV